VTDDTERRDLAAMAVRLARGLMTLEQPILTAHEVSMWGYAVLSTLRDEPVRAQSALARAIGADKTRLIPVLDELQRRGLIEREPDPADRRVHLLRLTRAGRDLQASVQAGIRAEEVRVLARLPASDQAAFVRSLQILSEVVGRPDAG
jgi:DNA-binding MarR family transcriptional regulator